MNIQYVAVLLFSLMVMLPAGARCAETPPEGEWSGKGQLGFVGTQGNTDSGALNAAIDMAIVQGPWKHALHSGGLYGKSSGIVSAERWDTDWQSNRAISADMFAFGALRYARDMFSGFQYQASASLGLGRKFVNTERTKIDAQLGAGYRRAQPEVLVKDESGAVISRSKLDPTSNAVFTGRLDYSQALTKTTMLTDKLLIESGSSNTMMTNELALAVKISEKLALSLGYSVQNNTNPPAGLKNLDSVETVNLVYAF